MLDTQVFKQGMEMMCTVANREPSDLLLDTYYALLKDLPEEAFTLAVSNVLRYRKYSTLPLPADIREAACGKVDDEAIIALDKLERATSTYGAYRTVIFDDPIIHAIVQSFGGWPKVCRCLAEEWKFRRLEFKKVYAAFAPNLHRLQIPMKLVGEDEGSNPKLPAPEPKLIGDPERIAAWQANLKAIDHSPKSTGEVLKMLELV